MAKLLSAVEETIAPRHLKEYNIKPGDDLHKRIAEELFREDYRAETKGSGAEGMTFSDWYQKNHADKTLVERLDLDARSYLLTFDTSDINTKDVHENIKELVLKAQALAAEKKSVVVFELNIPVWGDFYGVVLANGLETNASVPVEKTPVWLGIGTFDKSYNFVQAKKDGKTEILYVNTYETSDSMLLKYDN